MATIEKILGQLRPSTSDAQIIYAANQGKKAIITDVFICNVSSGKTEFSLYYSDGGQISDETTALFQDAALNKGQTYALNNMCVGVSVEGKIIVKSQSGNDVNFTIFGKEIDI